MTSGITDVLPDILEGIWKIFNAELTAGGGKYWPQVNIEASNARQYMINLKQISASKRGAFWKRFQKAFPEYFLFFLANSMKYSHIVKVIDDLDFAFWDAGIELLDFIERLFVTYWKVTGDAICRQTLLQAWKYAHKRRRKLDLAIGSIKNNPLIDAKTLEGILADHQNLLYEINKENFEDLLQEVIKIPKKKCWYQPKISRSPFFYSQVFEIYKDLAITEELLDKEIHFLISKMFAGFFPNIFNELTERKVEWIIRKFK